MTYPKYNPTDIIPYCVGSKHKLRLTLDITADDLKDMGKVLFMLAHEFESGVQDSNALGMANDCDYEYDILDNT